VLHFTGSANSSVDLTAIHDATDKLWVSFWFKLDSAFDSNSSSDMYLMGKFVNSTNYWDIRLYQGDGGMYLAHREGNGEESVSSSETSWLADTWYHIIASCSTVAGQRMIVNGGTAQTSAGDQTAISLVVSLVAGAYQVDTIGGFIGEMKE
ncbi:hypothetical protein LCGC14_3145940, partial [marine sediment metagenome]